MITIVGGTYREVCLHPKWDRIYGSGLRAAAAIAALSRERIGKPPLLHTWVSPSKEEVLTTLSETYGFDVALHHRKDDIEFQYDHGLSTPRLYPEHEDLAYIEPETIAADDVLSFSVIEGNVTINAKRLVFDPQAGRRAVPPSASGHSASAIAIVANLTEVRAMIKQPILLMPDDHEPAALGQALLSEEKCSVVVVKNGADGATVVTSEGTTNIPSFVTQRVFPIGSGDVFSAVFAFHWLSGSNVIV